MSESYSETNKYSVIRGATTAVRNSKEEIKNSVDELIKELVQRNKISPENILSITFSVTKDLDACFPASIARKCNGFESVAFLDCQQMYVSDDIKHCIRLMATVILPTNAELKHPYLRGASKLRPDRC